jgi:hypothetical protein
VLLDHLRQHDVVVSASEFSHEWDRDRHIAFARLAVRHGLLPADGHTLTFLKEDSPAFAAAVTGPDTVVLTWRPVQVLNATRPHQLCFRLRDLETSSDGKTPNVLHLTDAAHATGEDICPWSGVATRSLTSCARLGGRYGLSRLLHGFACEKAYCDNDRPEFVFVQPGSVSFVLKRPRPDPPLVTPPLRLVVQVQPAAVEKRSNAVILNGHRLGFMDATHLRGTDIFSFDVPEVADVAKDPWQVSIGPGDDPEKAGWDVRWAGLEVADEQPPGAAGCPTRACVRDERGEICQTR